MVASLRGCERSANENGGDILGFIWWLISVALWVIFLALTMSIARSKGHSPLLWGLLAVFFPLITVIVVLLLPNRRAVV
jgi:hypothetical protein